MIQTQNKAIEHARQGRWATAWRLAQQDSGLPAGTTFDTWKVKAAATIDRIDREVSRDIAVFVYGTLKRGRTNCSWCLGQQTFICEGVTSEAFSMFHNGAFPMVVDSVEGIDSAPIAGELWRIDAETLATLDRLERNGSMYQRRMVQVSLPNCDVEAWCYFYLDDVSRLIEVDCNDDNELEWN